MDSDICGLVVILSYICRMGEEFKPTRPRPLVRICEIVGHIMIYICFHGSVALLIILLIFGRWLPYEVLVWIDDYYFLVVAIAMGILAACSQFVYQDTAEQVALGELKKEHDQKIAAIDAQLEILAREPKKYDPDKAKKEFEEKLARWVRGDWGDGKDDKSE